MRVGRPDSSQEVWLTDEEQQLGRDSESRRDLIQFLKCLFKKIPVWFNPTRAESVFGQLAAVNTTGVRWSRSRGFSGISRRGRLTALVGRSVSLLTVPNCC